MCVQSDQPLGHLHEAVAAKRFILDDHCLLLEETEKPEDRIFQALPCAVSGKL